MVGERNRLMGGTTSATGLSPCEGISEREIVDAIRMNPGARPDGVKALWTAWGAARAALLAFGPWHSGARTRHQTEEVTKSGKGSYVLTGKTKEER